MTASLANGAVIYLTERELFADIHAARTTIYTAIRELAVEDMIPTAMRVARGYMMPSVTEYILRASVWDAVWMASDGSTWTKNCFSIVEDILDNTCSIMADFNTSEYSDGPQALARASAWRAIAATRTYETWVKTYKSAADTVRVQWEF